MDYIIDTPSCFNLSRIFDCGQCFRFNKTDNSKSRYYGVAFSKYIEISQDDKKLYFHDVSHEDFNTVWKSFFDLDTDYDSIISTFSEDAPLKEALTHSQGIRILKQDSWEALCSFIISQNNNIPRIKGIIENMSKEYGTAIHEAGGNTFYSFPTPKALLDAGEDKIFALKTGFRAKYIYDCARLIENGDINLDDIRNMPLELAGETLMKIKGVGPKVCACALLYGFGRYAAMPIDVWVKKILDKYYGGKVSENLSGKYAGIAQQYLFYHERCLNNVFI